MIVGICSGVIKSLKMDGDIAIDVIPVDVCVRAMIVAAWKRSVDSK